MQLRFVGWFGFERAINRTRYFAGLLPEQLYRCVNRINLDLLALYHSMVRLHSCY